jgi:hypothetical protein
MKNITTIRFEKIIEYLISGIKAGIVIGLIFSLLSLFYFTSIEAIQIGLLGMIIVLCLHFSFGIIAKEYLKRKKQIRRLLSDKYKFLRKHNFRILNELVYVGEYNGYHFRILPMRYPQQPNYEYDIIETYYNTDDAEKEASLCGEYYIGRINFNENVAGCLPKNWKNPNFKENFEELIHIMDRENLKPISRDNWAQKIVNRETKE